MKRSFLTSTAAALLCLLLLISSCGTTIAPADTSTEAPVSTAEATTEAVTTAEVTTAEITYPIDPTGSSGYTAKGDKYAAEGFKSYSNGEYTFDNTLILTFDTPVGTDFNKFRFVYTMSRYAHGIITYEIDGAEVKDKIYLEKGTDIEFSSFITEFLKGKTAAKIKSIEIIKKQTGDLRFALKTLVCEKAEVPSGEDVYIQNDRYKLGIKLCWGGGVSYIEDLQDGDDTLGNLLNRHDTGRLVQQSYYGTASKPYNAVDYNGTKWNYNPVQGGDQYGNHSRLIDFYYSDDKQTLYVKCLPADWAQNNLPSLSYMENRYTLKADSIEVYNRYIDYSGYSAPERHQELPAFYTISNLSKFVYYGGSNGWTGGGLTTLPNESFWGGNSNAYHNLKSKETWCAWISAEKDWGIGVYTPIATILLAGRYNYNGSKSPDADATNYVAPLIAKSMSSYTPYEYSYYITTGATQQIRNTFMTIYNTSVKK